MEQLTCLISNVIGLLDVTYLGKKNKKLRNNDVKEGGREERKEKRKKKREKKRGRKQVLLWWTVFGHNFQRMKKKPKIRKERQSKRKECKENGINRMTMHIFTSEPGG